MAITLKLQMFHGDHLIDVKVETDDAQGAMAEIEMLRAIGLQYSKPTLADGENQYGLIGWIHGMKKGGDSVCWLYTDRGRFATIVWAEDFNKLPFDPTSSDQFPVNSAPETDVAKDNKFFNAVEPDKFIVVKRNTGELSESGNPRQEFSRLISLAAPRPLGQQQSPPNSTQQKPSGGQYSPAVTQEITADGTMVQRLKQRIQQKPLPRFSDWLEIHNKLGDGSVNLDETQIRTLRRVLDNRIEETVAVMSHTEDELTVMLGVVQATEMSEVSKKMWMASINNKIATSRSNGSSRDMVAVAQELDF